jgi:hypothetical protein
MKQVPSILNNSAEELLIAYMALYGQLPLGLIIMFFVTIFQELPFIWSTMNV